MDRNYSLTPCKEENSSGRTSDLFKTGAIKFNIEQIVHLEFQAFAVLKASKSIEIPDELFAYIEFYCADHIF